MPAIITVTNISKTYASGFTALKAVNLEINEGEIFALLGPNGAGKTTLINTVCGIVTPSSGEIRVAGHDIARDFRTVRGRIGLVPQELTVDMFETVWATVNFSRGLFGKRKDHGFVEKILRQLSLWDKKDTRIMALSGGMKRRLLIAKALSHEPDILFLDEPTAGVDVELRRGMWDVVREMRKAGVTIILTTHYLEEAEEMADRIAIMSKGEIILTERKAELMRKLGKKQLVLHLSDPIADIPPSLAAYGMTLSAGGQSLVYTYDAKSEGTRIPELLTALRSVGIAFHDLETKQSSLEEIFVDLVSGTAKPGAAP